MTVMEPVAIQMLRLKIGETQAIFAERIKVHAVTVARWETGALSPDPHAQIALATAAAQTGVNINGLNALVTIIALLGRGDPDLAEHCRRVSSLAEQTAHVLGENPGELAIAGHLHDVGKATIPTAILNHRGRLEQPEKLIIQGHVMSGAVLAELAAGPIVARYVREHHERLDGSGYPRGLVRDEVSTGGRILGACDEVDARVEARGRGYRRKHHDPSAVIEEMSRSEKFDGAVVEALRKVVIDGIRRRGRPRRDDKERSELRLVQ
jgi:putative nucleotidyltransferase with HDIG domain